MLELKKIISIDIIKIILFSDCIWDRISEDGQTKDDFEIENKKEYLWLGVYSGDKLIGMFFMHPTNNTTIMLHIHILEKFRKRYAYESGKKIIKWFVNDAPENFRKMIAEIPILYSDVYHFSKKFGFKDEGINRSSFLKNDIIHDQIRLGLTREEANIWVQQQQ